MLLPRLTREAEEAAVAAVVVVVSVKNLSLLDVEKVTLPYLRGKTAYLEGLAWLYAADVVNLDCQRAPELDRQCAE